MVDKTALKNQQPVAMRILTNAIRQDRLSHAYLFYGPKGPAQRQMALLFAQSLVCENPDEDGLACQECPSCQRLGQDLSNDFFWLHPSEKTKDKAWRIRKEDIQRLQETFATSSVSGHRQIYVLEGYDQATPSASNALLKFLEEPQPGITGILLTNELSSVLPTIVSRCQLIPFRPASRQALEQDLAEICDNPEVVSILAHGGYDTQKAARLLEEERVEEILEAARAYWADRRSPMAVVHLQRALFSKTHKTGRPGMAFFFECLLAWLGKEPLDLLHLDIRQMVLEHLDALAVPVDPALLADRFCFELIRRMNRR